MTLSCHKDPTEESIGHLPYKDGIESEQIRISNATKDMLVAAYIRTQPKNLLVLSSIFLTRMGSGQDKYESATRRTQQHNRRGILLMNTTQRQPILTVGSVG